MNRFSSALHRTRTVPIVAVLAMSSLLVACNSSGDGKENADGQGETLTVLFPTGNPGFNTVIPETLGEDFTERTGIDVTLQTGADNYTAVDQQLLAGAAGGTLPDVAIIGLNSIETYRSAGLLQELDAPVADTDLDEAEIQPNAAQVGVVDGARYAMPYVQSLPSLFYNVDDFVAAGLDPEDPPSTYSELADAAEKIVTSKAAPTGVIWPPDGDGGIIFQNFVFSQGGSFLDEQGDVTFNDSQGVDVLSYWTDLQASGLAKTVPNDSVAKSFLSGDAAMWVATSSALQSTEAEANFKVGLAPVPAPDDGEPVVPIAGAGIVAFTDDPEKLAAAGEVIAALAGTDGQVAITTNSGYLPVNESALTDPAVAKLFKGNPNRSATLDLQQYTVPWFNFPGRNPSQIWDDIENAIQYAMLGEKEPQEALDDAAEAARKLLEES